MNTKDVTATEVRRNLTELLYSIRSRSARFRVLVQGKPAAALVPLADLEKLEQLDREAKSQS